MLIEGLSSQRLLKNFQQAKHDSFKTLIYDSGGDSPAFCPNKPLSLTPSFLALHSQIPVGVLVGKSSFSYLGCMLVLGACDVALTDGELEIQNRAPNPVEGYWVMWNHNLRSQNQALGAGLA